MGDIFLCYLVGVKRWVDRGPDADPDLAVERERIYGVRPRPDPATDGGRFADQLVHVHSRRQRGRVVLLHYLGSRQSLYTVQRTRSEEAGRHPTGLETWRIPSRGISCSQALRAAARRHWSASPTSGRIRGCGGPVPLVATVAMKGGGQGPRGPAADRGHAREPRVVARGPGGDSRRSRCPADEQRSVTVRTGSAISPYPLTSSSSHSFALSTSNRSVAERRTSDRRSNSASSSS